MRVLLSLLDNETAADVLIEMTRRLVMSFLEILPSETIAKRFVDYRIRMKLTTSCVI
jgi:magnesium transporter